MTKQMRKVGDEVWFYSIHRDDDCNFHGLDIHAARIIDPPYTIKNVPSKVPVGCIWIKYLKSGVFERDIESLDFLYDTFDEALQAALERVKGCPRCGSTGIHTCRIKVEG